MVVIILQYISVLKQYVAYFITTQCYMSIIAIKLGEKLQSRRNEGRGKWKERLETGQEGTG